MNVTEKKLIALTFRPHFSQAKRHAVSDPFVHLRTFLTALGNPEQKIPHYIHVTGTSGKGSTAAYLATILKTHGTRVGLTVSPHLSTMRERWQINGTLINPREFSRLVSVLTKAFKHCAARDKKFGLSFFELCTALALVYFAENNVEWAVLEVFSGGRVDPTNIIPYKDAAVITNIDLDHEHLLGNTKLKIAREKSGIIIPGTPVFTSENDQKIKKTLAKMAAKHSTTLLKTPYPKKITTSLTGTQFAIENHSYHVSALGAHQAHNATLAIAVAKYLGLPPHIIKKGLAQTSLQSRVEVVGKKPLLILDTAHNPAKIAATVAAVKKVKQSSGNLLLLLELPPHKDIRSMSKNLSHLKPQKIILTTSTINPFRPSLPLPEALKTLQKEFPALTIDIIANPLIAWKTLLKQVKPADTALITGSAYLAGQIRTFLARKPLK